MSIKITCKMCSKELEVPDAFAGKKGKCPHCFEVLDIPTAEQAAQQIAVNGAPAAPVAAGMQTPPASEPIPSASEARPAAPASAQPQPIPKPGAPRRARSAVIIPAAILVAVVVGAVAILPWVKSPSSKSTDVSVVPKIRLDGSEEKPQGVAKAGGQESAAPAPTAVERKPEPAAPAGRGIDRFPDTQKIAAGLPAKTALYLEIHQPREFITSLASQPVWKDKAAARQRCDTAYASLCQLLAREFGVREMDVQQAARHARAIHLAFAKPGSEPPVIIASLHDLASREKLLGEESTLKPANTLEFADIRVEEYGGELGKQMFAGYHGNYAVMGTRHDLVQGVLKRLRDETPDSLGNDPAFVQALATRPGEGTWAYFAPRNDDALAGKKLLGGLLPLRDIRFVQAMLDPQANVLSGSMAAEGLLADVLSGPPGDASLAAFAPAGCPLYMEFSSTKLDQVWKHALSDVFPEHEQAVQGLFAAVGMDTVKDFVKALGPHFAVMMPKPVERPGVESLMVAAEVPDSKTLAGSLAKLNELTKLTPASHRDYQVHAPEGSDSIYALGAKAILIGGGTTGLKAAIDTAAGKANLATSGHLADARKNGASAILLANAGALLQAQKSPLMDALAPDATTCLAAHEQGGAIRISGDLNLLGIACVYLSDAAQKRQIDRQQAVKTETLKGIEQCRQNIIAIHEAINRFVVKDIEENLNLAYPKTLAEVMDAGLLPDISVLVCPLDKEPAVLPSGVQSSYDFVFSLVNFRLPAEFSMQSLVVWERKPLHDGKHMAIRVDGHVVSLTPDELQKELEKSREEAVSKKPRQVDIPENR